LKTLGWAVAALATSALAGGDASPAFIRIQGGAEVWKAGTPPFPPTVQVAVLEGDPKAAGHFTVRVKLPKGLALAPHTHPNDERATLLSGALWVGEGKTADRAKAQRLGAGSFYVNPKGQAHFVTAEEDTVLQISTDGPWGTQKVE